MLFCKVPELIMGNYDGLPLGIVDYVRLPPTVRRNIDMCAMLATRFPQDEVFYTNLAREITKSSTGPTDAEITKAVNER